ncbi:MAG TPA: hypothetical protein VIP11_18385, partial [Gemmatimonadaceae bacterium]
MTRHLIFSALAAGVLALAGCGGDTSTSPDADAPVASVELSPGIETVAIGRTLALTATARAANG